MTQSDVFQRENLAYDEKISLAELEEAKALERVKELKYHKARFCLDYFLGIQKERDQQMLAQQQAAQKSSEGNKDAGRP